MHPSSTLSRISDPYPSAERSYQALLHKIHKYKGFLIFMSKHLFCAKNKFPFFVFGPEYSTQSARIALNLNKRNKKLGHNNTVIFNSSDELARRSSQ